MSNQYANSLVPEPYTVLGLKLKPFSLGHLMLMRRFDVAFGADTPTSIDLGDLLLGVFICSQSYEEFLVAVDDNAFQQTVEAWGEALAQQAGITFEDILQSRIDLFMQYLSEAKIKPHYWNERDSDKDTGVDWPQAILTILTSELGYTRSEALNAPLGQSMNDYLIYAERNGAIRLMTDDEIAMLEANKENTENGN